MIKLDFDYDLGMRSGDEQSCKLFQELNVEFNIYYKPMCLRLTARLEPR